MLTIVFLGVIVALLALGGVFAMMARSNRRKGQSGSPDAAAGEGSRGRASGLD